MVLERGEELAHIVFFNCDVTVNCSGVVDPYISNAELDIRAHAIVTIFDAVGLDFA